MLRGPARAAVALGVLVLGCGAVTTPRESLPPSPRPDIAAPPAASSPPRRSSDSGSTAPVVAPAVPEVKLLLWSREVEASAAMLAVGKKRVAVLENGTSAGRYRGVRMRDLAAGAPWQDLVLPERLQPTLEQRERLALFFGRDDRPRLMGTRFDADAPAPRYYRYQAGWRDRTGEIARLEGGVGTLFGVLGHDDPEVVCKLGEICIIKRLTGWTNVPAPSVEHHVQIAGGGAFAVAPGSALRIDTGDQAWRPISETVPWREPRGLWPFGDGTLWVVGAESLHHWDGERWHSAASPLPGARALWGRAPDDLWLAGQGGLAHYDGTQWSLLMQPRGDFAHIIGTSTEVWVGGDSGVWVGRDATEHPVGQLDD